MVNKGFIKKGEYFDSVSLMIVSKEITDMPGVEDSAVVMGTAENKAILKAADLMTPEFDLTGDTDLLIAIKAETDSVIEQVLNRINELFEAMRQRADETEDFNPKSFGGGLKQLPEANLSLISIPGKYAAREAMKALKSGLNVMLFSDNVSIEEELKLKSYANEKGLLVMGPDCGTAIINGTPLAFANVVNRGDIGIVAASGTGLQEVSSIISNLGGGISQAIGTGGRDVKKEIGGIMFLEGIRALEMDPGTKIMILVSKPPDDEVLQKLASELKGIKKPVVAIFIGGDPELIKATGAIPASTLEQAALLAVSLAKTGKATEDKYPSHETEIMIQKISAVEIGKKTTEQKYVKGLFSGGTLCDETQLIFRERIGNIFSNTPLKGIGQLKDALKSEMNTIIDLGDDEFTVGRPHPMIDFSLRNSRIASEAADPETAVILFDLVLGYGSNPDPLTEFVETVVNIKQKYNKVSFICSVTGTESDPQDRKEIVNTLKRSDILVCSSNAEAAFLSAAIIEELGGR